MDEKYFAFPIKVTAFHSLAESLRNKIKPEFQDKLENPKNTLSCKKREGIQ